MVEAVLLKKGEFRRLELFGGIPAGAAEIDDVEAPGVREVKCGEGFLMTVT